MANIRTEPHTDNDGFPSKRLIIEHDDVTISLNFGFNEANALAAALRPEGKDVNLTYGKSVN